MQGQIHFHLFFLVFNNLVKNNVEKG